MTSTDRGAVRGAAATAVIALLLAGAASAQQEEQATVAGAIGAGKASVGFRYRFEHVKDDNPALAEDTADASTLRMRLNYRTAEFNNWSAFGEFDYVGELLFRDFNSASGSSPPRNAFPVVADARGADLNQLYVDYAPSANSSVRVGRQRILLDNQRFVGAVGWRQNEQTYDGVSLDLKAAGNTQFRYAYVTTVRRIFGDAVPAGRHDVDVHLLNAAVTLNDSWTVTPYYYRIDNEDFAAASSATFGVRTLGKLALGENSLALTVEFANQADVANNPVSFDASYIHLAAELDLRPNWTLGIAWESLGGDQNAAGAAFRTPLATLHGFQGWADQFLNTPDAGVNDLFATVKFRAGGWNLTGVLHDFSAESGGADWGREVDLSAGRDLGDHYGILFKAAVYDADQFGFDTRKFWVMLTADF